MRQVRTVVGINRPGVLFALAERPHLARSHVVDSESSELHLLAERLKWLVHTLRRGGNHPAKEIVIQTEKDWSFKGAPSSWMPQ